MDFRVCRRGARLAFWLSVAVWVVLSLVALPTRADSEAAEDLIRDGLALRRAGQDVEALELFRRAQQANPSARALAQIALAEQALGRWVDAEEHLNVVLSTDDAWVGERRALLQKALEEVRSQLGTLEVRANRPGAEVLVDGTAAGTVPLQPRRLSIGTYEVVVRASGFKPVTRTVQIRPRTVTRVNFELAPPTDSVPPLQGVESGDLAVDQRPTTPPAERNTASWRGTAAWIALASAGALLIGSVTAHVIREREMAAYNDDSRCLIGALSRKERCGDHLDAAETAQIFAVAGYAVTGVALGASIYLFSTDASGGDRRGFASTGGDDSGALIRLSGSF